MLESGNRLYRCRCKVLYKFFNTDLGVVFDEKFIQDVSINLGWDANLASMNSETVDTGIMSFTGSMNTCSVTITDPYFAGVTWPSLLDVAGAAIGTRSYQSGRGDGQGGILRRKCNPGEDPASAGCWDYTLIDLENWLPTNNASAQVSTTKESYKQPAMIMISLWYEAYNGYTFGTDYLFRVSGSSATHGSEFPQVTLQGQGNFGITFQDRLVNVSIDNELEVEKALSELAARNEFNMEFCVSDYDTPNKLERKVIKSNITVKQLLDDIVKNKSGGNYVSLPIKEMYNTLHVCTRADTWPGCSVFYLGRPLYEGFRVTAVVDSTMIGKNYEFGDLVEGDSRFDNGSGYLPSLLDKDSAWEVLEPKDKIVRDITSANYAEGTFKVNFKDSQATKPAQGNWGGFKEKRDEYFTTYNDKLIILEGGKVLQKKEYEKVNPGWIGEFDGGKATVLLPGEVREMNEIAEGGGYSIVVKTDYVFYLKGMTSKKVSKMPVYADLRLFKPDQDVKIGYKVPIGGVVGTSLPDKKQNLAFYILNQNTKEYLEPSFAVSKSIPATYDIGQPNTPETLRPQGGTSISNTVDTSKLIREVAKSLGANHRDLAAIISFETGGDFDPNKMHGLNNNFQGWIGFSSDNRKTYGVAKGQSLQQHAIAVEKYLKDRLRGKPPTLHNMYWAINPGFGNSALDRKLKEGKHWENADKLLGGQGDGEYQDSLPNAVTTEQTPLLKFIWPASGAFTSNYGPRSGKIHRGVDIANAIGTPIYAAAAGTVQFSGWNSGGFGNLIIIDHGSNIVTYYAHNSQLLVKKGEVVSQGQEIAKMGSTGRSTGPHLHFEIRVNGEAIPPYPSITGSTVSNRGIQIKAKTDTNLAQPGGGVRVNVSGVTVSPGGQSNANSGQTAPGGGTGFSIETEFKGVPRSLRILPKFTILSFVGKYQEWLAANKAKEIDPGVWLPDYFRNWLIRSAQFNWNQGDLRVKLNASSVFGLDNSGIVPSWESYSSDLSSQGKYSGYIDYIRAYGDLCWNDNGQPSCHTRCAVTEDFIRANSAPAGSLGSGSTSASVSSCAQYSSNDSKGKAIIEAAKVLGVSALDLATIIEFESGGDKDICNSGGYCGLIQFSADARAQYGYTRGMSWEDQVKGPVVRYFQDRFKWVNRSTQGADLLTLYRTVLGGNPNADIDKKDSNGVSPRIAYNRMLQPGGKRDIARQKYFSGEASVSSVCPGATRTGGNLSPSTNKWRIPSGSISCYLSQLMNDSSRAGTYSIPSSSMLKSIGNGQSLVADAADAFILMQSEAKKAGISLTAFSGFRSGAGTGGRVFNNKPYYQDTSKIIAVAQSVATSGKSQHNSGFAIDLAEPDSNLAASQINSSWYKWLVDNAYKYGFINSFPPKVIRNVLTTDVVSRDTINPNSYIIAEPWHWLFVGSDSARNALKLKKC